MVACSSACSLAYSFLFASNACSHDREHVLTAYSECIRHSSSASCFGPLEQKKHSFVHPPPQEQQPGPGEQVGRRRGHSSCRALGHWTGGSLGEQNVAGVRRCEGACRPACAGGWGSDGGQLGFEHGCLGISRRFGLCMFLLLPGGSGCTGFIGASGLDLVGIGCYRPGI